ncbi:MAG: PAS-domain containing protein [Roseovarius sp.]
MGGLTEWAPIIIAMAILLTTGVFHFLARPVDKTQVAELPGTTSNTFLLKNDRVIDHDVLPDGPGGGAFQIPETWDSLRDWLQPDFPNLPPALTQLNPKESRLFASADKTSSAQVTITAVRDGRYRVTLADPRVPSAAQRRETAGRLHRRSQIEAAAEGAACPTFILDEAGRITWGNAAFARFGAAEQAELLAHLPPPGLPAPKPVRVADSASGEVRFFEPSVIEEGGLRIVHATDVTRIVRAESVRGAFIQTLTKTFADLATGLAVFDHSRRLVLFNPALLDLTGLTPEFLIAKPGLMEFFDHLRDRQVLPEPKSYADWRAQISRMIECASEGQYSESWYLPNGLTYRFTGHPHPDGAVAFLIEDVTDQVAIARRYRTQIETRQAVLDGLPEAIAVIGQNDVLVFTNRAFNKLIGYDPDTRFAEIKLKALLGMCRKRFPDPDFWETARLRLEEADERPRLRKRLAGNVECRIEPLPGRFALVGLQEKLRTAPEPA